MPKGLFPQALTVVSWVYAGLMTVVNIILAYIVLPLRKEVEAIKQNCQQRSAQIYHLDKESSRQSAKIERFADCIAEIKDRTTRTEEKIDSQRSTLEEIKTTLNAIRFNSSPADDYQ